MTSSATDAARDANDSEWLDRLARVGLVALGVVHLVLAWLMITLALGDREGSATSEGAMRQLADTPLGAGLVWAVAIGLFLLALWQGLEAAVGHRDADGTTRLRKRAVSAGKAVVYVVIGASGVSVATGSGGGGDGTKTWTARLLDAPGGQVLVALVGLAVIGVGVALLVYAWREKYLKHLDGQGRSGDTGTAYRWLGRIGHVAKGLALGAVGALFLHAAATHEADKSGGLDQALRRLLDATGGPALVIAVGLGFGAYGLFCFAWSRHLDR
ncbi:DUF1206 domain-containing protein [Nocardioides sp. C4-1]|uniref:DUF1206 domain-containing protein n=1 Tax=Nocardioides sp. C4-1 TaxID=3151851 RepID=UPI0032658F8E